MSGAPLMGRVARGSRKACRCCYPRVLPNRYTRTREERRWRSDAGL